MLAHLISVGLAAGLLGGLQLLLKLLSRLIDLLALLLVHLLKLQALGAGRDCSISTHVTVEKVAEPDCVLLNCPCHHTVTPPVPNCSRYLLNIGYDDLAAACQVALPGSFPQR